MIYNIIYPAGEILSLGLRGRFELERGARTIVDLLREKMDDGSDRVATRPASLKERLGLKGFICCGASWSWGVGPNAMSVRDDSDEDHAASPQTEPINSNRTIENGSGPPCGMNLATALAAERQLWAAMDLPNRSPTPTNETLADGTAVPGTPPRVSLMRLLEETDGYDCFRDAEGACDQMCCVCMVRKKGAAFIPCGHTFCRVCSRELWLNRPNCPLCNRLIREVLDIY